MTAIPQLKEGIFRAKLDKKCHWWRGCGDERHRQSQNSKSKPKGTPRLRRTPPLRGIKAKPAACAASGGVSQQKPASSVGRQYRCRAEAPTYRQCGRHRGSHRFYSPLSAGGDGAARRGSGWRHRQTQKNAPDGATPASALREIQCHAPHKGIHFEQTLKQFAMCACPNKREAPSFKRPLLVIDK